MFAFIEEKNLDLHSLGGRADLCKNEGEQQG